MAWTDITDDRIDAESEIRDDNPSIFKELRENLTALLAGTGGAPPWRDAAFTPNSITLSQVGVTPPVPETAIEDGAVNSSSLIFPSIIGVSKMAISSAVLVWGDPGGGTIPPGEIPPNPMINPGGIFYLGYKAKMESGGYGGSRYLLLGFSGMDVLFNTDEYTNKTIGLTYMYAAVITFPSPLPRVVVEISYLEASPPYELGGYEVPYFLYALLAPNGIPVAYWGSPAPPWAYNGPTEIAPNMIKNGKKYRRRRKIPYRWEDTRADRGKMEENLDAVTRGDWEEIEITPEYKNSDLRLIPQPFIPAPGYRVVLADPLSPFVQDLQRLALGGEPVGDILADKYISIGTDGIPGAPGPNGIPIVRADWRVT